MLTSTRARPRLALAAGGGGPPTLPMTPALAAAIGALRASRRELAALVRAEADGASPSRDGPSGAGRPDPQPDRGTGAVELMPRLRRNA
jgi:hypothetical protein